MYGRKRKLIKESYEKGVFRDFELKVLLSGAPDVFLPPRVLTMKDRDLIFYETQSFTPLSDINFNNIFEPLSILLKLVAIVREVDCYMLYPERVNLNYHKVYINSDNNKIRCCYLQEEGENWQDNLKTLVQKMDSLFKEELATPYFKEIGMYLEKGNHSYKDITIKLEEIIREATISIG